ncbi:argininosuccinate synthase [Amycolatopsis sp. WAC 01376]|uniref:argininosuccinate synthase domain-containing protein n=1 Tax=Amycolatopsis sp. WAC 01376 TaxID=2203195 RepID=UPI000F78E442|nr:argininosuccinate synthase domain-containing protein [Amycolatopsis sp. WAC 01376]RSM57540.1 argininosuccinate synthase [Amycolatopsis sp. WAC 01376]
MTPDGFAFPDDPEKLVITFDEGVPVAIDGETVTLLEAFQQVNRRVGAFGLKGREIYESPGALALVSAHDELEKVSLGRVSGEVRLVLHRGNAVVNSARDERTLYDFGTGATFDRSVA